MKLLDKVAENILSAIQNPGAASAYCRSYEKMVALTGIEPVFKP